MSSDPRTKVLRYAFDEGGTADSIYWDRMFNSTIGNNWFRSYNVDTERYEDIHFYGGMYDYAKQYYHDYGVAPTRASLESWVENHPDLGSREKTVLYETIGKHVFNGDRQSSHFEAHLDELKALKTRNGLSAILARTPEEARKDPRSCASMMVTQLTSLLDECDGADAERRLKPVMVDEFINETMLKYDNPDYSFSRPFPFESWNRIFGGMNTGEVIVFAAKFNSGKSFLLKELLWAAYERCGPEELVVCCDMEMNREQLFFRAAARLCGLPISKIQQRMLDEDEEMVFYEAMRAVYELGKSKPGLLFLPTQHSKTTKRIRAAISQYGQGKTVTDIGIDYLTLMQASDTSYKGWEGKGQVVEEMKDDLAMYYNVPVITPIHINKEGDTQYQVVDQKADTVYKMYPLSGKAPKPPFEGEWYGTPGIIEVVRTRSRGNTNNVKAYVEADFSTSSLTDSTGELFSG